MVRNFTIVFAFIFLIGSSGCKITKFIGEEEQLLVENKIIFKKNVKVEKKQILKTELETLFKQVPNKKQLGFLKLGAYLHIKLKESEQDTVKETKLERSIRKIVGKRFAEQPAIFDENLMELTRQSMVYYLQNRGYFDVEVDVLINVPPEKRDIDEIYFEKEELRQIISKQVEVSYLVNPNRLYKIDSVTFFSKDTAIHKIINEVAQATFLKKNAAVDGNLYDLEATRLTNVLRSRGYAFFTSNYVGQLEGDTTNYNTKIKLEVLTPGRDKTHKKYKFGSVRIYPHYQLTIDNIGFVDSLIGDYQFARYPGEEFYIKPEILSAAVFLKPGLIYNDLLVKKTQRKLSDLGVFRFVNIKPAVDTLEEDVINFEILLTPRKKWETGFDIEPNFTERQQQDSRINLFGFSTSTVLGNKNLARGAESLNSSAYLGLEFNLSSLNAFEFKQQNDVNIPRFVDYLKLYRLLNRFRIISDKQFLSINDLAKTRIRLGYNYQSRDDFYTQHLFNASFGYDLQDKEKRLLINNLAIDFVNPTSIGALFAELLDQNNFLKNSFGDQLFTGFFFRDVNYIYNSRSNRFGESYYLKLNAEISGAEILGANKIYNWISGVDSVFKIGDDLEFSQYAKMDFDIRYNRKFNPKNAIAFRISSGIGAPYGNSSGVPYVKQFYVGGPQSIRAWAARGIGPGSYVDPISLDKQNSIFFYQTGDFKFEANAEYRRHLFNFFAAIELAIFLDIGNVWTLKEDLDRPGSQLQWKKTFDSGGIISGDNFFNEMAVGSGLGWRFDFSYFLLRFDIGVPLKNPYRTFSSDTQYTYLAYPDWTKISTSDFNFNLGVNYPF